MHTNTTMSIVIMKKKRKLWIMKSFTNVISFWLVCLKGNKIIPKTTTCAGTKKKKRCSLKFVRPTFHMEFVNKSKGLELFKKM